MVIGMDENQNYFDNVNQGGLTPAQIPKDEKGSGKGVFLIGMIVGIASALLVMAVCWLGVSIQNSVEKKENHSAGVELEEGSAVDANMVEKLQILEKMIEQYYYLGEVTDEDFNTLIKVYEDAIVKDVSSNKYSPTVKITKEQKELLNFGI